LNFSKRDKRKKPGIGRRADKRENPFPLSRFNHRGAWERESMDKIEKDRLDKYGKLVWDFANSKTTDDILTSFFENLQSAFCFSSDFKEKALKIRPTKKSKIGTLSEKENYLFEMMVKRKKILSNINSDLGRFFFQIDQYDPAALVFTISEFEWESRQEDTIIESGGEEKTISIPASEIEAYIKNLIVEYDEINLKAEIKELIELSHQIEDIKSESTNRFAFIESLNKDYERIIKLHNYVSAQQAKLKTVLLGIIEAEQAFESEGFKSILTRYNSTTKKILVLNDQEKLVELSTFAEDIFLKNHKYIHFEDIFNAPISYCLVEYLKHPEYSGKERISVCQYCNCIFSKSKLYEKQKYCSVCSRKNKMTPEERTKYQQGYRSNPAFVKKETRKKREEKIRHLMKNAGKTRKQAEQIIDNDR
jgi:hypothetical protein